MSRKFVLFVFPLFLASSKAPQLLMNLASLIKVDCDFNFLADPDFSLVYSVL